MGAIYSQAVIRAQLSILSNPPVNPIDANTGLAPQFWRAAGIQIDVGVFDGNDNGINLGNLQWLQLAIYPSQTALVPWVTQTIAGSDINSPILFSDWQNDLNQNASFILSPAQTDLGLLAEESRQFWMTISGITQAGVSIVYGAGPITIYNPGYTLPPPASLGIINQDSQVISSPGTTTVYPNAQIFTQEIEFSGGAGTYNLILSTPGLQQGARIDLLCLFEHLTPGLVINVYSGSITGSPIFIYTTDAYTPNALFRAVVNGSTGWDPVEQLIPAFIGP
jgi:hypothetical protein